MSDILIRGIEMPKDIEPGLVIEFADGIDGKRYARPYHYRHGGLTEWLEAVSVPDHGRLINDDVLNSIEHYHDGTFGLTDYERGWNAALLLCKKRIEAAPTIIPAEEVET
jgi:hypothetical protein